MIWLDTKVVRAYFNGNKAILTKIQEVIDKIALSTLVIAELDYGTKASKVAIYMAQQKLDKALSRCEEQLKKSPDNPYIY